MGTTEDPQHERPRLAMLREMTDRAVLLEVIARGRVTRAELATVTGISKPTISQSVRRLEEAQILVEAGADTGRRGRVATFYELADAAGWVLGVQIDQGGLRLRSVDLYGRVRQESQAPPVPAGDSATLVAELRAALRTAVADGHGPLRACTISVANPVDPTTGHIIAMPDSPFPEGQVRLDEVLADLVGVEVQIENDVNLAALAERSAGAARDCDSFAYVYLGGGLGMGLWIAGQPVRGAHGLAGEIGALQGDRPGTLAKTLHEKGFGVPGGSALDVPEVVRLLESTEPGSGRDVAGLASALAVAIASTCAVVDPRLVVLGGPIGGHPALVEPVRDAVLSIWPGPVQIERSTTGEFPALQGAVQAALGRGREALVPVGPTA